MRARTVLLVALLLAANVAAAGEAATSAPQWQAIELGTPSSAYRFAVYSNHPLTGSHARIARAVVIQHGLQRDGDKYYEAAVTLMADLNVDDAATLLIVPQFFAAPDAAKFDVSGMPVWTRGGWLGGENAVSKGLEVSSLQVYDDLLRWLADRQRFPALKDVVLAGHSAGAQLVHRYAVLNRADEALRRAGLDVRYVIANPSSYLYFTDERPRAGVFVKFDGAACPNFNQYKYGFVKLVPYAGEADPRAVFERYALRNVTYLLGEKDNDPQYPSLDKRCAAQAQGASRLDRGRAYLRYERYLAGERSKLVHRGYEVLDVAHDQRGMFRSVCGARAIFAQSGDAADGAAQCQDAIVP